MTERFTRLGRRLLVRVVLLSSVVTLTATGVQLAADYDTEIELIDEGLDQVSETFVDSVEHSVWGADSAQIGTQLAGLTRMPGVARARILVDDVPKWEVGSLDGVGEDTIFHRSYPLTHRYRGQDLTIGVLSIDATDAHVRSVLADRVAVMLATNGFRAFLVSGLILWLFHGLVSRHLLHLVTWLRRQHEIPVEPVVLDRTAKSRDELDELVDAFHELFDRLAQKSAYATQQQRIVQQMADAIIVVDRDGTITDCNPAAVELFGLARDELLRSPWPVGDAPALEEVKAGVDESGVFERRLSRKAMGNEQVLELAVCDLPSSDGSSANLLAIFRDRSEHEAMEQELRRAQRLEVVGQLTGGVAHDFNNLLTVVMGNLELLNYDEELGEAAAGLVRQIAEAATRGQSLTHRLLAFSRRQTLQPKSVDLNRQVEQMVQLLRRTLEAEINIETDLYSEPVMAVVDPSQLEAAVFNMAINSRDAMPGGGTLTIATRVVEEPGEGSARVALSVADDGSGMDAETLEHAFEPFFTTKEVGKGSGLGLSMVYGFARQSGGEATVRSKLGEGTVVELILPAASGAGVAEVESEPGHKDLPMRDAIVVLVEDDSLVRNSTRKVLERMGITVREFAEAPAALQYFEASGPCDLLLSDVMLPGAMLGPALAQEVRLLRPNLPVLLVSGYSSEQLPQAEDFPLLTKPFHVRDLSEAVTRALERGANAAS